MRVILAQSEPHYDEWCTDCKEYDHDKHCCPRFGRVIREVVPRWIPCSERLPDEEKKHYWVCTNTGYQCQCRWTNNVFGIRDSDEWGWKIFDIPQYSHVVAWMPMPEPYEENKT